MHNKLKFGLILIAGIVSSESMVAQQNLNFVRSWVAQKPIANEVDIISASRTAQEVIRTTEYVDGFGRSVQSVIKQASPALQDVVDMHVYDNFGREVRRYLPFTSNITQAGDVTNDGNYKPTATQQQLTFNQTVYPGEGNFYYAQFTFENSPLNRALDSYAPGTNWVGSSRGANKKYVVNTAADNVRIWNVPYNVEGALPTAIAAYGAGQLFKSITTDEQGNQTIQFQDKEGHVILVKQQHTAAADNGAGSGHSGWLCTYFVYDDYGNLRFEISPKAVALIDGTWSLGQSKGDGVPRKYSFNYDKANRLTTGSFVQNTSGSTWDNGYMDFSVNNQSYDQNGNITGLNQNGFVLGGGSNIDKLAYNYGSSGTSNKLQNVVDSVNNSQSKLGDFKYPGSKLISATDYTYDPNGNKNSDYNKSISSITYNVLGLPYIVTVTGKGTITYTFDGAGNKLKKDVQENNVVVNFNGANYTTNITTVTTYIGAFVYRSKTYSNVSLTSLNQPETLQYAAHEEGRARIVYPLFGQPAYHAFDYFVRDNLGNVRVTLSDELQQDTYPAATLEAGGIATETSFYNIVNDANHVVSTSSLPWWGSVTGNSYQNNNGVPSPPDPTVNPTATSTKLYKLNGATGDRFGMGIALKVMSGDVINIFGRSVWHNNAQATNNSSYGISSILTSFINAFAGTNAVTTGSKGAANGTILNANGNTTGPLSSLLNGVPTPAGSTPKAYINWILFDEQFKVVTGGSGVDAISAAADVLKVHAVTGINVAKSGYLYIYCSNESNQDVYFDNLQVVHNRGPLIEERHFYPNGLAMFALSSRAYGKLQTNFGYQGKELQSGDFYDGSGLEEYDFVARFYDPQLGRWWSQDPMGQFASPYNAMANNWPAYVDPDGRLAWFVPVIAGALLFGAGNLAIHAQRGDIDNFWDGVGFFFQGAIVGAAVGATWSFAFASLNGAGIIGSKTLIDGMSWASHGIIRYAGYVMAAGYTASALTTVASAIRNPENAGRILMGNAYIDENASFLQGIFQGISRFTWEGIQTMVGYNYAQIRNAGGGVDRVDFMAGGTFITDENRTLADGQWRGVSLSNFLVVRLEGEIQGNFEDFVKRTPVYMHEYGHTFDSRIFGPLYFIKIGYPSATGDLAPEIRANQHAARYFGREYGVDWSEFEDRGYPTRR